MTFANAIRPQLNNHYHDCVHLPEEGSGVEVLMSGVEVGPSPDITVEGPVRDIAVDEDGLEDGMEELRGSPEARAPNTLTTPMMPTQRELKSTI